MEAIVPSATIYLKNLNDKLKTEPLKKQLHMMFSQYGKITQIVACKGPKLRGQVTKQIGSTAIINSSHRSFAGVGCFPRYRFSDNSFTVKAGFYVLREANGALCNHQFHVYVMS
jgi:hypothetical protein